MGNEGYQHPFTKTYGPIGEERYARFAEHPDKGYYHKKETTAARPCRGCGWLFLPGELDKNGYCSECRKEQRQWGTMPWEGGRGPHGERF